MPSLRLTPTLCSRVRLGPCLGGESPIRALAKESGRSESELRYPGEEYETSGVGSAGCRLHQVHCNDKLVAVVAINAMPTVQEPVIIPDPEEAQVNELRSFLCESAAVHADSKGLHRIQLPDPLYRLLSKIIQDLANGKAISLTSAAQEMTTQEGANFLGVSRQFLVRLLDDGKIPFHRVGTHRRVYLQDMISFRKERDRHRHVAIQKLAQEAVANGVYDEF
jgi:excisionase family DNA binding protein